MSNGESSLDMFERDFTIAMANRFRISAYDSPYEVTPPNGEWLIVRYEAASRHIIVSDAQTFSLETIPDRAPNNLSARNSFVGVLANKTAQMVDFLTLRSLPAGLETEGTFFPSEGFFTFYADTVPGDGQSETLRLKGSGRFSLIFGTSDGVSAALDRPADDPDARKASWHFSAWLTV
ncbi:MAG: hypothetical protein AAF141_00735 [Pseudomonadota bacterium]